MIAWLKFMSLGRPCLGVTPQLAAEGLCYAAKDVDARHGRICPWAGA